MDTKLCLDVLLRGCQLSLRFYGEKAPRVSKTGPRACVTFADLNSLAAVEADPTALAAWERKIAALTPGGNGKQQAKLKDSEIEWIEM